MMKIIMLLEHTLYVYVQILLSMILFLREDTSMICIPSVRHQQVMAKELVLGRIWSLVRDILDFQTTQATKIIDICN